MKTMTVWIDKCHEKKLTPLDQCHENNKGATLDKCYEYELSINSDIITKSVTLDQWHENNLDSVKYLSWKQSQ